MRRSPVTDVLLDSDRIKNAAWMQLCIAYPEGIKPLTQSCAYLFQLNT